MQKKESAMDYIKSFSQYLLDNGKADKTIESYTGDIKGYIRFLGVRGIEFEGTLNRFTIISYKNHLLENSYEPVTVNKKLNSIQSFNDFLIEKERMSESVINLGRDRIKIAKGSEKPVEVYPPAVVNVLMFHLETNAKNLRDKVLVQLLLQSGIGVSELVGIRIRDIDFLSLQLKVVGKGGKYREIPLKAELVDTIKKYIIERCHNPYYKSEFLLMGQRGPLGRDTVNRVLTRITKEAKLLMKLKPHTFRHTFATMLINKNVPITTVSKLLGHSGIDTSVRFYLSCSREEKQRAVNLL